MVKVSGVSGHLSRRLCLTRREGTVKIFSRVNWLADLSNCGSFLARTIVQPPRFLMVMFRRLCHCGPNKNDRRQCCCLSRHLDPTYSTPHLTPTRPYINSHPPSSKFRAPNRISSPEHSTFFSGTLPSVREAIPTVPQARTSSPVSRMDEAPLSNSRPKDNISRDSVTFGAGDAAGKGAVGLDSNTPPSIQLQPISSSAKLRNVTRASHATV